MPTHAIIFDLDDTLFDHARAMRRFLRVRFGVGGDVLERLVVANRRGRGEREPFCCSVAEACDATADEVDIALTREFGLHAILEGVEVLDRLSKVADFAILTNGGVKTQWTKYDALGLERWFPKERFFVSAEIGLKKPSLEAFEHVVRTCRFDRGSTLFVGDDLARDIRGAEAAGLSTCWVARGETVLDTPASYTVNTVADLWDVWSRFTT